MPNRPARLAIATVLPVTGATILVASVLVVLLTSRRGEASSVAEIAELAVAMSWIAGCLHAVATALLAAVWFPLAWRLRLPGDARTWAGFLSGALLGLDVAWALWNRLGMAHQFVSVRPFMTWAGVLENVIVLAVLALGALAGLAAVRVIRPRAFPAALGLAATLVVFALARSSAEESRARVYPLERVVGAVSRPGALSPASLRPGSPVIVLGLDGLSWGTLGPLLRGGHLPNLARLVREGAIGHLDNGDESLSARIWTTIFSGRSVEDHGIAGFTKLVLPRTGATFPDLLSMTPSIDTFWGLEHLLAKVPDPGLWRVDQSGSADRRVKMLWDVASEHGRRVVVANALGSVPVTPVDGVMITYREHLDESLVFPAELAERWRPAPWRDASGRNAVGREDHYRRLLEEIDFTRVLLREVDPDVGVYYTHYLDTVSHWNWDFHSRGEFLIEGLPSSLDLDRWETLVLANANDPAFHCYFRMDDAIGRLLESLPQALVIVCSDHGWTYSGYEHFGSPEGVLIVSGPGTARGVILDECRIEDVTPTVLALTGVPLSAELPGRFLAEAFVEPPDVLVRGGYGAPEPKGGAEREGVRDPEELERLRALGYVN